MDTGPRFGEAITMTGPVKFLWDNEDKRVKRIEIPESSERGLAKVHADHLKKKAQKKIKRPRR